MKRSYPIKLHLILLSAFILSALVFSVPEEASAGYNRHSRALRLYNQGVFLEAARELRIHMKAHPEDIEAGKLLGKVLLRLQEYAELADLVERLLEIRPDDPELLDLRRRSGVVKARPVSPETMSIAELENLLKNEPGNIGVRIRLIDLYVKSNRDDDADEQFREILRRHPQNADYHLRYARFLAQRQRIREAENHYQSSLRLRPDSAVRREMFQVILRPSEILLREKKYDEALEFFSSTIARYPGQPLLQLQYARILSWTEQYEKSIEIYREYLAVNDDPNIRLELARVLSWKSNFEEAQTEIEKVRQKMPESVDALVLQGDIMRWTDNPDVARRYYLQALDIRPNHPGAQEGLDELKKIEEQRQREAAYYNLNFMIELVKEDPGHIENRLQLARLLSIAGDYEAASLHFEYYLDRKPDNLAVHLEYGRILSSKGDLEGAADRFRIYLHGNQGDISTRSQLADLLFWQTDYDGAEAELERIISENPRDTAAHWNLARIHRNRENWDEAMHHLRTVRELDPNYRVALASIREIESHPRYIIQSLLKEAEEKPHDLDTRLRAARMLVELNRFWEASEHIDYILEKSPGHREATRLRAESEQYLVRYRAAQIIKLREKLQKDPDPHTSLELARFLSAEGEEKEAISRYRSYVQQYPDDHEVRREFARVLSWSKTHQREALREYEYLSGIYPDDIELKIEHVRLMTYDRGLLREAERKTSDLLVLRPHDEDLQILMAEILLASGQTGKAREQYEMILENDPDNRAAKEGLNRIRNIYRPEFSLAAGKAWDNDEYREDFLQVTYTHYFGINTGIGLIFARHDFEQINQPGETESEALRFGGVFHGRIDERSSGRAWLGISRYDIRQESIFWGARVDYVFDDVNTISLDYAKDDVIYDVKTVASLDEGIDSDRLRIEWVRQANPDTDEWFDALGVRGFFSYAAFSDGNRQTSAQLHGLYSFRSQPDVILIAGWQLLSYSQDSSLYWSPESYTGPMLGARLSGDSELFGYELEFNTMFSGQGGTQRGLNGRLFRRLGQNITIGIMGALSESPRLEEVRYQHIYGMAEINARF